MNGEILSQSLSLKVLKHILNFQAIVISFDLKIKLKPSEKYNPCANQQFNWEISELVLRTGRQKTRYFPYPHVLLV
jgi:hypothetical protein